MVNAEAVARAPAHEEDLHAIWRPAFENLHREALRADLNADFDARGAHAQPGVVAEPPVAGERHADFVTAGGQRGGKRFQDISQAAGARQRSHFTAGEEDFHANP